MMRMSFAFLLFEAASRLATPRNSPSERAVIGLGGVHHIESGKRCNEGSQDDRFRLENAAIRERKYQRIPILV